MKNFKPQLAKSEQVAQNLYILTSKGRINISPQEIIYLEAEINYTTFHTLNSRFTTSFHLKFFGEALNQYPDFLRINKSYLINTKYLKGLDWQKNFKEAQLTDGTRLPISRRKAKELKEILWNRLNG